MKQNQVNVDTKQDQFQEEVYATVQNLSKEMNEAFIMMHKLGDQERRSPSKSKSSQNPDINNELEILSKVTDTNIKNVFNTMDKQKLIVNDRLERIEMNHDKLKAHFKGIEDAVGNNALGGRKSSRFSPPGGAMMGDQLIKMD
jgi:hypothetical protein